MLIAVAAVVLLSGIVGISLGGISAQAGWWLVVAGAYRARAGRDRAQAAVSRTPTCDNRGMKLMPTGVVVTSDAPHLEEVLTPEALDFVAQLHRSFNPERERLLADRADARLGSTPARLPDFLPNPIESRDPDWRVAPAPADFDDRRVEITGPAEPKMMINALNSGASVFMCDFEDALSPTW